MGVAAAAAATAAAPNENGFFDTSAPLLPPPPNEKGPGVADPNPRPAGFFSSTTGAVDDAVAKAKGAGEASSFCIGDVVSVFPPNENPVLAGNNGFGASTAGAPEVG